MQGTRVLASLVLVLRQVPSHCERAGPNFDVHRESRESVLLQSYTQMNKGAVVANPSAQEQSHAKTRGEMRLFKQQHRRFKQQQRQERRQERWQDHVATRCARKRQRQERRKQRQQRREWHGRRRTAGTTATTTVTAVCEDTEQNHCQLYKDEGYCDSSCTVIEACQKTCGFCDGGESTTTTTTRSGDVCEDTEQNHCQLYKEEGYCASSASVKAQCKRTCGFCGDSTTTTTTTVTDPDVCEDIEQNHCQLYESLGYCQYPNVQEQCRRTCCLCGDGDCPTPPTPAPVGGACEDTDPHCQLYSDEGYCEDVTTVRAACRRTCDLCDDGKDEP